MADKAETDKDAVQDGSDLPRGVLIELENVIVDGRAVFFDLLKRVLGKKGVELTASLFSRYLLDCPFGSGLKSLLADTGKQRVSDEKLLAEIKTATDKVMSDNKLSLAAGVSELLKQCARAGIRVGLLTSLAPDTAAKLLAAVQLSDLSGNVISYPCTDRSAVTADWWLKLAKAVAVPPGSCVALATTTTACKSALAAHMRCVAIVDDFSSYQDFGGVDLVVESLTDDVPIWIVDVLAAH